MILITYTRLDITTSKKQLDYVKLEALEDVWGWLEGLNGQIVFSLNKKKRVLTPSGFRKSPVVVPNLLQVVSHDENTLFNVLKIVSDEGVLFDYILHSSEKIVDLVAAKYEFKPIG